MNPELKAAVGQHHTVAGLQAFQNNVVVKGQVGQFVHAPGAGAQQQPHALADLDGVFRHHAQADFGAGKILHDGDGTPQLFFDLADVFDDVDEVRSAAVGKIEPEHADARLGQRFEFFFTVGSRTNGGDDFCSHGVPSRASRQWLLKWTQKAQGAFLQ